MTGSNGLPADGLAQPPVQGWSMVRSCCRPHGFALPLATRRFQQQPVDLGHDLGVAEAGAGDGMRRAGRDADAAALAERGIDIVTMAASSKAMALKGHRSSQIRQPEQRSSSTVARYGSSAISPCAMRPRMLRRGRRAVGDAGGDVARPQRGAGGEHAVGHGGHRVQLGVALDDEALAAAADAEHARHVDRVRLRLQAHREDDHVHRDAPLARRPACPPPGR